MSITTFSKFYYLPEITASSNKINFSEASSGELEATLNNGGYTMEEGSVELKRALEAVGQFTYTVDFNRATRRYSIASASSFSLLITSGTNAGDTGYGLFGFSGPDVVSVTSASGALAGFGYEPQFILQDYVASSENEFSVDATVNQAANGTVEVFQFGTERFVEMNIRYIHDSAIGNSVFKADANALANAIGFLSHCRKKLPIEFMPDADSESSFENLLLESTPDSKDGVGFKIKELVNVNLPTWYETGVLKFRKLD